MDIPVLNTEQALARIRADLAVGRSSHLVVTGGSMVPFLRHGKCGVVLTAPQPPYRRGDILFYVRVSGQCILHRVQQVQPDGTLTMCGDGQLQCEPIAPQQVVAQVSHIRRGSRFVPCSALPLRCAVAVWQALLPVRKPLLGAMVRVHRLFSGK